MKLMELISCKNYLYTLSLAEPAILESNTLEIFKASGSNSSFSGIMWPK